MEKLLLLIVLLKLFSLEVLADSDLPKPPDCGKSNLANSRVFNGTITGIDEYPWMGFLTHEVVHEVHNGFHTYSSSCTSSLITSNWVLTAGHCVFNATLEGSPLFVYQTSEVTLGVWDINDDRNSVKLSADRFIHPNYYSYTTAQYNLSYDIALLRLKRNVEFTPYIQRICLPLDPISQTLPSYDGARVIMTGWGDYKNDTPSDFKRKATSTVGDKLCRGLSEYQLCVKGTVTGGCGGDSGGPLLLESLKDKNTFYQIGVASLGRVPCIDSQDTTVYVRVDAFIDWIRETIQQQDHIEFE